MAALPQENTAKYSTLPDVDTIERQHVPMADGISSFWVECAELPLLQLEDLGAGPEALLAAGRGDQSGLARKTVRAWAERATAGVKRLAAGGGAKPGATQHVRGKGPGQPIPCSKVALGGDGVGCGKGLQHTKSHNRDELRPQIGQPQAPEPRQGSGAAASEAPAAAERRWSPPGGAMSLLEAVFGPEEERGIRSGLAQAAERRPEEPLCSLREAILEWREARSRQQAAHTRRPQRGSAAAGDGAGGKGGGGGAGAQQQKAEKRKRGRRGGRMRQTEAYQLRSETDTVCYFWRLGRCANGSACKFSHDCEPVTRRLVCKFHRRGACRFDAARCPYSHDLAAEPCKHHILAGRCGNQQQCAYSHAPLDAAEAADLRQALLLREAERVLQGLASRYVASRAAALQLLGRPAASASGSSDEAESEGAGAPLVNHNAQQQQPG